MKILVIDGQGGRLGKTLVEKLHAGFPQAELVAIGTNTIATEVMRKAGADRCATGENAVCVACRTADVILGPLGIIAADSLMGEISPRMANAVASAPGYRVLIPMNLCDTYVAGVTGPASDIVVNAIEHVRRLMQEK